MVDKIEGYCETCSAVKMIEKGTTPDCPSSLCDGTLEPKGE